jgi:hypothetical protein
VDTSVTNSVSKAFVSCVHKFLHQDPEGVQRYFGKSCMQRACEAAQEAFRPLAGLRVERTDKISVTVQEIRWQLVCEDIISVWTCTFALRYPPLQLKTAGRARDRSASDNTIEARDRVFNKIH